MKQSRQPEFEFFPAASNLEISTWTLIFQVVIDLIVDAEQNCRKSNNNDWIWNALDQLFGYLVTLFWSTESFGLKMASA